MKRDGTAGDTENAADLPGGLALGGPPEAFELARRQRHALDDALAGKLSPGVRVEKERHELQHLGTRLDIAEERGPGLVGLKIGRESCRERGCPSVLISVGAGSLQ